MYKEEVLSSQTKHNAFLGILCSDTAINHLLHPDKFRQISSSNYFTSQSL